MTDYYDNEIVPGNELAYTEPTTGTRHVGTVEYDPNYRGKMRVGGRSILDILDHCDNVKVIS